jgi:dihydropteroate synthase
MYLYGCLFYPTTVSLQPDVTTYSLNCRGRLLSLAVPQVMGILNLTPDSFSDGGQYDTPSKAMAHVERMLTEGASIIDIGGFSSRPGADRVAEAEELRRIEGITRSILRAFPQALVSIDTYRPTVAQRMLDLGVHLINDITGGRGLTEDPAADSGLMALVAQHGDVPYCMMHMQGTPETMQQNPQYQDLGGEIAQYFVGRIHHARSLGLKDVVIDPGFGFGKSLLHNHQLLHELPRLVQLGCPVLVGLSRKRMMYSLFDTTPGDVLDLATALHLQALQAGVRMLRVHDVREAVRVVQLYQYWQAHGIV